jgi:heme-degrading monooxygenase HmoA
LGGLRREPAGDASLIPGSVAARGSSELSINVAGDSIMIARSWRGSATHDSAASYERHFTTRVAPHLKDIPGHRGAYLLRREMDGRVEFLAVTLWESMETIKAFAGPRPEVAIVEAEARAALAEFDDFATHYEVAHSTVPSPA